MRPELELVQQWLERAQIDLRSAKADLAVDPPITEDACFHCQQVAEKTLKAFLIHHGIDFERTHEIERLIKQCTLIDSTFIELHANADRLTNYAVRFRYPYPGPSPTLKQTQEALAVAQRVWAFVMIKLPPEVVPQG